MNMNSERTSRIVVTVLGACLALAGISNLILQARIDRLEKAAANAHACAVAAHERLDAAGVPMNGGGK